MLRFLREVVQNYLRNLIGVLGESGRNSKRVSLLIILRRLPEESPRSHQGIC